MMQVVLEDGRIIEEGEPEVTVDTVEDVESHSDDGEEDRHIVGGWSRSFHPDRALQSSQPGKWPQECQRVGALLTCKRNGQCNTEWVWVDTMYFHCIEKGWFPSTCFCCAHSVQVSGGAKTFDATSNYLPHSVVTTWHPGM